MSCKMFRHIYCLSIAGFLAVLPLGAVAQDSMEVSNVEYLEGVPSSTGKVRGSLRISPTQIVFQLNGKPQFLIPAKSVDYVAAQAKASMRARTADIGVTLVAVAGAVAPVYPLVFLFHKREKHLLSIEYLESEPQVRRLALFDVHDHSALAVKKMIDDGLGLTPEYYKEKDGREEERRRQREAATSPAGHWETQANAVVGDSQYDRYLVEPGRYSILIFDRYIGFRPEGMQWAKYRVPIRERKPDKSAGSALDPIHKSSRLVAFRYQGTRYVFF